MKTETEDLKLLAERMGLNPVADMLLPEPIIWVKIDGKTDTWSPTESAEQCLMVLEWLEKQEVMIELQYNELREKWNINIMNELSTIAFACNADFKTAVVMAAIEYCKNMKP